MKNRLYQATALAAGTLALSTALRNAPLQELICDSALTGGALWAGATVAVGNFAQSNSTTAQ